MGTAIIGAILSELALVQLSPTSSKSQIGKVCPDIKAIAFPTSNPLPPPKAITPSQLFFLKLSTPSFTFVPVGLPTTFEYNLVDNLFLSNIDKVFFTISVSAKPLSVTSNGLLIPKFLQATAISLILFSPTHIVVG